MAAPGSVLVFATRKVAAGTQIFSLKPGGNSVAVGVLGEGNSYHEQVYTLDEYADLRRLRPDIVPELPKNTNTVGEVQGESPTSAVSASEANPEVSLSGLPAQLKKDAQATIDDWVASQGDSRLAMAGGAVATAVVEVFMPEAWWELIPAGKVLKWGQKGLGLGKKGLEAMGMLNKTDKAVDAGKDAKKAVDAGKDLKKTEEAGKDAKKAEDAGKDAKKTEPEQAKPDQRDQVRKKRLMKCGEYGRYGKQKQKTGQGKFDRDHIPSKAALKERAQSLLRNGKKLSPTQAKAIDNWGQTIAIPRQAHIDVSPTHGQSLADAAVDAAGDLQKAARRDVEAMLKKIDEYDADGNCRKAYQKSAAKIMRMSDADYNAELLKILKTVK